ncbi:MAG: type II secretion system protein [Candidatus Riflebacteria bacterium]|nr:type II secretion system protein [Candidatus Riflebacteria bacterium]
MKCYLRQIVDAASCHIFCKRLEAASTLRVIELLIRHMKCLRKKAFSLVEISVCILLISIVAGTGFPRLVTFMQETRLEQEARAVFEDICLTRQSAITNGGTGESSVILRHLSGITSNPIISYELLDPAGDNVYTVFMDDQNRKNLSQRNICIVKNVPAASAEPFTLRFNSSGRLTFPANAILSLYIRYFNPDTNSVEADLGTWCLEINATSTRMFFRKM